MLDLTDYVLSALAALIALTIHEFSHAYAAYKLGDETAKNMGRLTLNPMRHLDPFGAICLILFHFGWAKPVPINPRYFKNPKKGFAISSAMGPISNLIMAFISAFLYLLFYALVRDIPFESEFLLNLVKNLLKFVYIFHSINIGLAIFNLLPIPPLDGSRLITVILPPRIYFGIMKYERRIYLGLICWLIFGDIIASGLLSLPFVASSPILSAIAKIFSLSDLLSSFFALISDAIMSFWRIIPFLR